MAAATGGKLVAWSAIAIVLAGAVAAGLVALAAQFNDPITRTVEVAEPPLTLESSVKDAAARINVEPQTGSGQEIGEAVKANCPTVDVYPLADGAILVCRQ